MSDENNTFHRCPHDKENPYTMISRELIRDKTLSPDCRWLIIYLLANRDNWKIHIREIINHCQGFLGRNRVYEIVNEAIEAGYISREEYLVKNMTRVRYLVSESPKFKKCFRHPGFRDAEARDTENGDAKEEATPKGKQQEEVPPPAIADAMCKYLHAEIVKRKSNFSKQITKSWIKHAEKILKIRSPEEVRKVIDWVMQDPFWSGVIQSTDSLEKNLDKIETQMVKKPSAGASRVTACEANRKLGEKLRERLEGNQDVSFGSDYIEFDFGPMNRPQVSYSDKAFREQVENYLRKMGLSRHMTH